jgi:hypothetical protein
MKTYLITYDLMRPGQNYSTLIEAIKEIGAWYHCLASTWLVNTTLSAEEIRDLLKPPIIDTTDKLLVVRLHGEWACWFPKEAMQWLHDNMSAE